jgi:hypothetical protein
MPMKKVPTSEARRERLEVVFSGQCIDPGRIVREQTRLMIEQALEAGIEQAVGRRYDAHAKGAEATVASAAQPKGRYDVGTVDADRCTLVAILPNPSSVA